MSSFKKLKENIKFYKHQVDELTKENSDLKIEIEKLKNR